MDRLLFGTAGIPIKAIPRTTINGIKELPGLGLEAMELEFVHSVNIAERNTPEVKETAGKNKITLTCHGQYYMNLNSAESRKVEATINRILSAARIAWKCGAWSLCFHAAYYMGDRPQVVYSRVVERLKKVTETLHAEGNGIWIRPEITGKDTQFGTLEELLRLSTDIEGVMPCIDFSHFHARTNGKYNTYREFSSILESIEKSLGKEGLKKMHIHVSGIEYGPKGEKKHLVLAESDFNYRELARAWRDFGIAGVVICESPNLEDDAILLKKAYKGK